MKRARAVLGILAGVLLLLSGAAHSILGWSSLQQELAASALPPDLLRALRVGWIYGGVAMVCFGVMAVTLFARRLRGSHDSVMPAAVVAVAYLAFGAWTLVISDFEPFFLNFVAVGAMLGLAAWPGSGAGNGRRTGP